MRKYDYMTKYYYIKKAFAYLESEYGFHRYMKQVHGAYYYIAWTNGKKDIMVLYDDRIDEKIESPVWIRIFDADSFGTQYDDVDEYRSEFYILSGSPKERIYRAAKWLREAIENQIVLLE
mgnify:FL=1